MKPAAEVRDHLVRTLEADLVGPFDPERETELLEMAPSRWYLTGFIAPEDDRELDTPEEDEQDGVGDDVASEDAHDQDPEPKRRRFVPASMGMSLLVPTDVEQLTVTVRWADYHRVDETAATARAAGTAATEAPSRRVLWQRLPPRTASLDVPLDPHTLEEGIPIPDSDGLVLEGSLKPIDNKRAGVPPGTRALALFVVNRRTASAAGTRDSAYAFQVNLRVDCDVPLVPRPNPRDEQLDEWDARVADLQFRHIREYATGHGVAVETVVGDGVAEGTVIETCWVPVAEVPRVVAREAQGVEVRMDRLAALDDSDALRTNLLPLVEGYRAWIEDQRGVALSSERRAGTRDELMEHAEQAAARIERGIEVLATDPTARRAFQIANRAMAASALARSPARYEDGSSPSWRLFQLAFVLLNVAGIVDDAHDDREAVELIFFPTGGGKTEAYLGVIAFTLVLRRLRGRARPDGGLGVTVILRYTLRLLTLDQLGRAATLVCALEKHRRQDPTLLGDVRFSVGLWVGASATANSLAAQAAQITDYKNNRGAEAPCPLTACPWCGTAFTPQSFKVLPSVKSPERLVLSCADQHCDFSDARHDDGLPVVYVDEQIYRELPSFLIGTVDKFALLPYRAEAGMLFGRVSARRGGRFYGTATEAPPEGATQLPGGLHPPELIVQDELHLISGPLGTMVGLYETAVDHLCQVETPDGRVRRPKLLASTATVRRASHHVRALFARDRLHVFPPPGIDENETWFSVVDRTVPGRLYAGVAAAGRPTKNILLRTYASLLSGAQKQWLVGAGDQPADAYMTLVGYFNSLRELGGMRRLVEDEARSRCANASKRAPVDHTGPHPWFADRDLASEPAELTSRESTLRISATKARLEQPFTDAKHVDVVLASNMISVGVDIDRLGLMVVAGQPKSTSEYIQASSRVGRRADRPGLVVTCYNLHRPRDRSHYEGFVAFHRAFYRHVEPTSLTPFSAPALQRGFAGALMAMIRHGDARLMPAGAVHEVPAARDRIARRAIEALASRAAAAGDAKGADALLAAVRARGENLLDRLDGILRSAAEGGASRVYSTLDREGSGRPIISPGLEESEDRSPDERAFRAPTSMRDVEPSVHVWVYRGAPRKEGNDGKP